MVPDDSRIELRACRPMITTRNNCHGNYQLEKIGDHDLPGRRAAAPGHLRPQAERSQRDRRPVPADRHECPGDRDLRAPPSVGADDGQDGADVWLLLPAIVGYWHFKAVTAKKSKGPTVGALSARVQLPGQANKSINGSAA